MSIYATWWSADPDEHEDGCDYWEEIEVGVFHKSGKPCSTPDKCIGAPYVYQGSHVLPKPEDPRGGYVCICAIPGHIRRDGLDDEETYQLHDYLRLSVAANENSPRDEDHVTVLLTRRQVEEARDTLTAWLERGADNA